MSNKEKYIKIILKMYVSFFMTMVFLFSRSFVGLEVLYFRVGEISMLLSLIFLLFSLSISYKYEIFPKWITKKFLRTNILFVISFFIIVVINNGSFIDTYTYKSSSYIWSIGFLYIGLYIGKELRITRSFPILVVLYFVYLYTYAINDFPSTVIELILTISDKYEPHKGSDILIMLIVPLFALNRIFKNERTSLNILLLSSALFLPLLLYKSRGAFLTFMIFLILEIYVLRKNFKNSIKSNTIIFILFSTVFLLSSSIVTQRDIRIDEVSTTVTELATYRIPDKNAEFNPIFFLDDRFYSSDSNLNWRLQIWQDVITDMSQNNLFLTGYGFNEKIPAMNDPLRAGDDGLNENIHNFLLNVFARGGLIHFTLYVYLIIQIIKFLKNIFLDISYLSIVLPVLLASLFDASMENAHFPIIFYFFIGIFMYKDKLFQNRI
jgi:hypothetical protein